MPDKMGVVMKPLITLCAAFGALGATACGSPTAPAVVTLAQCRPAGAGIVFLTELRVVVVGTGGRPLAGLPLRLEAPSSSPAITCSETTTNNDGVAGWMVLPARYTLFVRNEPIIVNRLVNNQDEWRVSVPE